MHIIYNEKSGDGRAAKKLEIMKRYLSKNNVTHTIETSEYSGHSAVLAKNACERGVKCIVAFGGDGTVREVASGMVYSNIPLGIIPAGTGNDLARCLKIPTNPVEAIETILAGNTKSIDAGTANGNYFFNAAGLGFDVDVLIAERQVCKWFKGSFSYIIGIIKALVKLAPHQIEVVGEDGSQTFEDNAFIALVGNGKYVGGGLKLTPKADLSDGLFDICVISKTSLLKVLPTLIKAVKGKHLGLKVTRYFQAKEITITSKTPQPIQLDGEIIEETPVVFKILPGALNVFVKAETE